MTRPMRLMRRATERPELENCLGPPQAPKADETFAPQGLFATESLFADLRTKTEHFSSLGKSQQSTQHQPQGAVVGSGKPVASPKDIAVAATLRAAAIRNSTAQLSITTSAVAESASPNIIYDDLRVKSRRAKAGTLLLFVVDSSGSMGARKRMALVKGVILDLLSDAYRKRDRIGMIVFRGERAKLLVPPTNSVELAEQQLRHLPTGGKTPLVAGLELSAQVLDRQLIRTPGGTPLLVLVTDGRGNVGGSPKEAAQKLAARGIPTVVLDSEEGYVRIGEARELARYLNGSYATLDQIQQVVDAIR